MRKQRMNTTRQQQKTIKKRTMKNTTLPVPMIIKRFYRNGASKIKKQRQSARS